MERLEGFLRMRSGKFILVALLCSMSFMYGVLFSFQRASNTHDSSDIADEHGILHRRIKEFMGDVTPGRIPSTQKLELHDKLSLSFYLNGAMFNDNGQWAALSHNVTTALTFSFSPWLEKRVKTMFPDPRNENIFYANSPAIIMDKDNVVLVIRVWLDKERYEEKKNWPQNYFKDNYFYTQRFNNRMKPLDNGRLMGIPSSGGFTIGDGPIEPRVFKANGQIYVSYNTGMFFKWGMMDYTLLWDYTRSRLIIPEILGGSPMLFNVPKDELPRDKHWSALIDGRQLYFVQHLDPLRVMSCKLYGSKCRCKFVYSQDNYKTFVFDDLKHHFRGGTPFELYEYPYYISISHVTLFKKDVPSTKRYYTAHIVVLRVRPYRIVYVSEAMQVHKEIMDSVPIVRSLYIEDPFIFPVGLIIEDRDSLSIGLHISDYSSIILRMRGLKKLMKNVIAHDKTQTCEHGPPENTLQTYIRNSVTNNTGIRFHSSSHSAATPTTTLDNPNPN